MGNQNVLPLTMYAVLAAYDFPETLLGVARYGQGHINDTYCVVCQPQEGDCVRFILQGLSMAAFPHPEELMENMIGITSYLREKIAANGGDTKRETLSLVKTKDGKNFFTDSFGIVFCWTQIWFGYLSKFEDSIKTVLHNTFRMFFGDIGRTLLLVVILAVHIAAVILLFLLMPPFMLIVPGSYLLCYTSVLRKLFAKYLKTPENEAMQN